jgi:hypothetical protein
MTDDHAPIPLVDLKANYQSIKPEVDAAVADVRTTPRQRGGALFVPRAPTTTLH